MSFHVNVVQAVTENQNFRKVLYTGHKSQLVAMCIPPGGDIGEETHDHVEQTLYFHSGVGEAILNGKSIPVGPGSVVIVTPGTKHNFVNTGTEALRVATVYAPANHIDGRVHATKADAEADVEDENFIAAER